MGARARPGRREPAAGHGGRGRLAGQPGRTALRGGPRGRRPCGSGRRAGPGHARRRGPGPGPGVAAGRRAAAGRARATPRRRRDPGAAARAAVGLGAGLAGPRPGRAGPAGPPADAPAPARQARKGTAFHEWLEQRYGQQRLIDDSDLFGPGEPGDDHHDGEPARGSTGESQADLSQLRARFDHSEWADRWPRAVEVPFETLIGDRLIRGRIDAVFADAPGGGYDVVDWKTGRPPSADAERHAVSVQLAAYRLAWATLAGVPVSQVRAAFHYVADELTVRPADLLDETALAALITQIPVS